MGQRNVNLALCCLAIVTFLFDIPAYADEPTSVHYELIGRSKGLTTNIITALYQDRSGLIWIGSRDGLRVYDGYSFRLFDHDQTTVDSISDNSIRCIFEDSRGRLWIGTNTAGLELLDRSTGKFTHFRHSSSDSQTLSHDSVYVIVEDRDGSLWVGTQKGLNHVDPDRRRFTRFVADPADPLSLSNDYVNDLHVDREGVLWIATVGGGVLSRDPRTGRFTVFRHDEKNSATINSDMVSGIVEGPNGAIWIGTDRGVAELQHDKKSWKRFGRFENHDLNVTSLHWGAGSTLWAGTLKGLYEIGTSSGSVKKQEWAERSQGASLDSEIIALLTDDRGGFWVGTWGSGLFHGTPSVPAFGQISTAEGLSYRDVVSLLADRSGALWIGTQGGGLNRREAGAAGFRHFPIKEFGDATLAIYQGTDAATWIGTFESLGKIDPGTFRLTKWKHNPSDPSSLSPGYVIDILEDSRGQLWVGTGGGGVNRLKKDGKGFEHFQHRADDSSTLSDDYITVLFESSNHTLWVGTRSGGLNECDAQEFHCRRYVPQGDHSIGHHYVTSIFEDSGHRLWVGTAGGGLNLLQSPNSTDQRQFVKYTTRDGLPDNNVMSIAEDNGKLWLGTRHGLVLFDPSSHQSMIYSAEDGLPAEEFNNSAVTENQTHFYFGTPGGLLTVARGATLAPPQPSPTMLTSVRSLNNAALSDLSVTVKSTVEVPYGTVLAVEAAVLDFSEPSTHRYQYQLEGLAPQWVELGSRRSMTFTDLSPGDYRLNVRGRNSHGIWSNAQSIELHVIPPFWMRTWFRTLLALLVVAILIAFHRRRTAVLIKRNRQLLDIQAERERALQEARTSEQALQVAYGRLQTLTRRMGAVAEEERRRIAHELHDEMGQMLTAAKINLQLLPSQSMQASHLNRITDTVDLVDNMISRVRALSLDLRPPLLYELGLMPALRAYVEGQARRSGLKISIDMPNFQMGLSGEVEIVTFRVVQEALTNVIRHANASQVDILMTLKDGFLRLEIRDDGSGFDVEEVDSRAALGDAHHGLAGIRERAQLLGGQAFVTSGKTGATIIVNIPVPIEAEAACK